MARWFRMHESTLDDPKVQQRLSDSQFRAWVNLLCLACRHDGVLPPLVDIAFALRRTEKEAAKVIAELIKHELIDETETGIEPHNWHGRQYKSDVSNERVKRHRQRTRNVTSPVTATPSESEADTEQSSDPIGSGGAPPERSGEIAVRCRGRVADGDRLQGNQRAIADRQMAQGLLATCGHGGDCRGAQAADHRAARVADVNASPTSPARTGTRPASAKVWSCFANDRIRDAGRDPEALCRCHPEVPGSFKPVYYARFEQARGTASAGRFR
jgi:hypothetical protein